MAIVNDVVVMSAGARPDTLSLYLDGNLFGSLGVAERLKPTSGQGGRRGMTSIPGQPGLGFTS